METITKVLSENKWLTARQPYSPDRMLCRPDCEVCGGVGYISYDAPVGDPMFGKVFPCPRLPMESSIFDGCGMRVEEIKSRQWGQITLRENVSGAVRLLKQLFGRRNGVGYLYGGPGLAKTLLLQTFCAEWARAGRGPFLFITQKDILDDLRTAYDDNEPQRAIQNKQDKYIAHTVLAIDEVTIERSTEFKVEEFFHIVNKRHEMGTEQGQGFITLMAGNVKPEDLDFRIQDRLTDGDNFTYKLTGTSYRPMMKRGY